jgi:ferric-dicitrate binding protein FerR (iron transport regulator)
MRQPGLEGSVKSMLLSGLYEEEGKDYDRAAWEEKFRQLLRAGDGKVLVIEMEPEMETYTESETEPELEMAKGRRRSLFSKLAAAAVLILLVAGAVFLFNRPSQKGSRQPEQLTASATNDVAPGGNKAILTLGNGATVVLDSARMGVVTQQGNAKVIKREDGQLLYEAGSGNLSPVTGAIAYNTLSTPRGGQYQLTLPDGTKVWLNAISSITYPTAFNGKEREVRLKGQAYFEVATNSAMPFIVKVNNIDVKVLGTHFDIMAYEDETAWKTTLLEGKVSVGGSGNEQARMTLRPGNQALIDPKGPAIKVIPDADTELAIAWKNGYTAFKSADIRSIMRQVERWYDMSVSYEGDIPRRVFTGKISRGANLSEVFNILVESKIHFRIDGKNIIVTP